MPSSSPSSQLPPLPQTIHPHPYCPPPTTTVNDPPYLVSYSLYAYFPLLLVFCCVAFSACAGEPANQPQPQDIEQGGPRNPPQQQQQQQQRAPREVSGTVVKYRSHNNISNCSDCAICLDDFREGEQCRVLDGCKHMYHKPCIDKWLHRDKHCPLCRGSVRGGGHPHSNHQNQI